MKGLGVFFNTSRQWREMRYVFEKSWHQHMEIPLQIIDAKPPKKSNRVYGLDTNTKKLDLWVENFSEDTIFCDVDMLVRGDITTGFRKVSNIGYTIRNHKDRAFNAGVIFAKYTEYSKKFFKEWRTVNYKMLHDKKFWEKYTKKIPGINQPALAYMLDQDWQLDPVPEIYNMCDIKKWRQAKMIHIKSEIRDFCLLSKYQKLEKRRRKIGTLRILYQSYLKDRQESENLVDVHIAGNADWN